MSHTISIYAARMLRKGISMATIESLGDSYGYEFAKLPFLVSFQAAPAGVVLHSSVVVSTASYRTGLPLQRVDSYERLVTRCVVLLA